MFFVVGTRWFWTLIFVSAVTTSSVGQNRKSVPNPYHTQYYIIHHDLDLDGLRELVVRTNAMVREYQSRCSAFGRTLTARLPLFVHSDYESYLRSGGRDGTAGLYTGRWLIVHVGIRLSRINWSIIQHEGFHQFAHMVIGGNLPNWADEGLAEYFGEALFTGDGFVSGIIPAHRAARVRRLITDHGPIRLEGLMRMSRIEWHHNLRSEHYDLAWSVVQFLAHGEDGRHERAFNGFLRDIGAGIAWERAWERNFGRGFGAFEKKWRDYWLELGDNPTAHLYQQATLATLTSYLARAASQRQTFDNVEDFLHAARERTLTRHAEDWLPDSLLARALEDVRSLDPLALEKTPEGRTRLTCMLDNGSLLVGTFRHKNGRVSQVQVVVEPAVGDAAAAPR